MARIIVLGAGFAGLWAAIGAARKLDEIGRAAEVEILVIDRNPYHNIRVRNYEVDLSEAAIPLADLLDPIGVAHRAAEVQAIDLVKQQVTIATRDGPEALTYDRLVLALGSELARPAIPGLAANGFDVDTYAAAVRLDAHLAALGGQAPSEARSTVVVVGAGFTGIEVATEMPGKLDRAGVTSDRHIILVDPSPMVGVTIGDNARPVINEALSAIGVETRLGVKVARCRAEQPSRSVQGRSFPHRQSCGARACAQARWPRRWMLNGTVMAASSSISSCAREAQQISLPPATWPAVSSTASTPR